MALAIDRVYVDADRQFTEVTFRSSARKQKRADRNDPASQMVEAEDSKGTPQWTVTVYAESLNQFGREDLAKLVVTVPGRTDPGLAFKRGDLVTFRGLVQGLMVTERGETKQYWTADDVVAAGAVLAAAS